MRTILVLASVVLLATPTQSQAQPDTLTVLESFQITFDGQLVDYFVLDVSDSTDDLWFQFIQDSAYVMLMGAISGIDTTVLPDPIVWMKISNPTVGDTWVGMLPRDGIQLTDEEIVGTKIVSVGAGNILVYEIGVWAEDGSYIGEKWYADGIGLVGWDIVSCNESEHLELLSYDLAPSSDAWPHDVGNEWVIESQDTATSVTADVATLTVDGNPSDWVGITAIVQDPAGDDTSGYNGNDIRDLYAAIDATNLYLMVDFWDGAPDTAWGAINGLAYVILLDDDQGTFWGFVLSYVSGTPGYWSMPGINIDAARAVSAVGSVIEISIPLIDLGFLAYQLPYYSAAVGGGDYDISCGNTVMLQGPPSCPIAVTGDVQNSGNVNSTDIIYLVNYVLKGGPDPMPCPAGGDANCTGDVNSTDIIYLVNYVLKAGPAPCNVCALIPGTWSCP
jgi:hypothetical protein